MSEQATQQPKKKKIINFKFGIRKEFFKAIIFMCIFGGVMAGAMMIPGIGMYNGMAIGMSTMAIMITLSNDMSLEPLKNGLMLIGGNVGLVLMAFIGYGLFPQFTVGRVVLMSVATFATFFLAIVIYSSDDRGSMYMPVLLGFSLMLYYNSNTTGVLSSDPAPVNIYFELGVRLAIYAAAGVVALIVNLLLHGKKFRKKILKSLDDTVGLQKQLVRDIREKNKTKEELLEDSTKVEQALTGIESSIGTKMSIKSDWQHGHDLIRAITILKRLNKTVAKQYLENDGEMPQEIFETIMEMLENIDEYENERASNREVGERFELLIHHMHPNENNKAIVASLISEMSDFFEGEIKHEDKGDEKETLVQKIKGHVSSYTFIFAGKYALLAGLSVLAIELVNFFNGRVVFPMPYLVPLYIGLTAQPYLELSTGNVKKRIVNTIYAAVLILISFSIPLPGNLIYLHLPILAAVTLIGDMFFQFDYMTMMGTLMSIIINVLTKPDDLYSYTFWRVGYIVGICLLVQIVDFLIFPRRIPETIKKHLKESLAINQKLRRVLADSNCDFQMLHDVILEKRRADQRLRVTNRYAKNDGISAYIIADEEWLNRLTMINHRLKRNYMTIGEIREYASDPDKANAELTAMEKIFLTGFDETLESIGKCEKMAAEIDIPVKEKKALAKA